MAVAVKTSFWVSVVLLVSGKIPDNKGLVTTSRKQHIWARAAVSAMTPNAINWRSYFSNEVAKLVTHPLWPSRVPRITNCSAMLG